MTWRWRCGGDDVAVVTCGDGDVVTPDLVLKLGGEVELPHSTPDVHHPFVVARLEGRKEGRKGRKDDEKEGR
jgi:hypothetical protein